MRELVNILRNAHLRTPPDLNAVAKLEQFLQFLETLQQGDIKDLRQWVSELDQRCGPGWQECLHMKTVLKIFGFSDQVRVFVNALQVTDRMTWGEYSLIEMIFVTPVMALSRTVLLGGILTGSLLRPAVFLGLSVLCLSRGLGQYFSRAAILERG